MSHMPRDGTGVTNDDVLEFSFISHQVEFILLLASSTILIGNGCVSTCIS
jgi:hypothetical protein